MANQLRRYIFPDETMILASTGHFVNGKNAGKKFVCKTGPGMNPKARGAVIVGLWEDGSAGSINGFWIDEEATKKLKEQTNEPTN